MDLQYLADFLDTGLSFSQKHFLYISTLLGTFIGALSSGFFVHLCSERKQAYISVLSVKISAKIRKKGFCIDIDNDLRKMLNSFHWTTSQENFKQSTDMSDLHEHGLVPAREFIANINKSKEVIKSAIEELSGNDSSDKDAAAVVHKKVLENIILDPLIIAVLAGKAFRETLTFEDRIIKEEFNSDRDFLIVHETTGNIIRNGWIQGEAGCFSLLAKGWQFGSDIHYLNSYRRGQVECLVKALVKYESCKLIGLLNKAKEEMEDDKDKAEKIVEKLDEILLQKSFLISKIKITNTGKIPIVIYPDCDLFAKDEAGKYGPLHMSLWTKDCERTTSQFGQIIDSSYGFSNEFLAIEPGSSRIVEFASRKNVSELSDNEKELNAGKDNRKSIFDDFNEKEADFMKSMHNDSPEFCVNLALLENGMSAKVRGLSKRGGNIKLLKSNWICNLDVSIRRDSAPV